jgi:hypothetical protein
VYGIIGPRVALIADASGSFAMDPEKCNWRARDQVKFSAEAGCPRTSAPVDNPSSWTRRKQRSTSGSAGWRGTTRGCGGAPRWYDPASPSSCGSCTKQCMTGQSCLPAGTTAYGCGCVDGGGTTLIGQAYSAEGICSD